MSRLNINDKMPDLTVSTAYKSGVKLSELVARVPGKTAIQFLRYYGCTLCQFDIIIYKEEYEKIAKSGGQLIVVLQSDQSRMASQVPEGELPFDIICDPDQAIYKEFDIKPAASREEMIGPETMAKVDRAKARGFSHGEYEGCEEQLPASFIVDHDLKVVYSHYATAIDDVFDPDELAKQLA